MDNKYWFILIAREKLQTPEKKSQSNQPSKKLRSSFDNAFNWKQHCFIGAKPADTRHTNKSNIMKVLALPLRDNLVDCAQERNDDCGKSVLGRLESCDELAAEEAVYYATCMTKCRLTRSRDNSKGKPMDKVLLESFENVCEWLESEGDCDLHTLKELQQKMKDINGKDSYSSVYLKKKLKERYNDHVYFSELSGQADVICFREMANYIIKLKKKKQDETKADIIMAAAKIIKAKIREVTKSNEVYPTTEEIANF